jgi:hypothetical protein
MFLKISNVHVCKQFDANDVDVYQLGIGCAVK